MNISFIKMNGLGNDFVIMDNRKEPIPMTSDFMKSISNRRTGVGCDQAIVVSASAKADIYMHIYNQDGSVAGACGNATRCVADITMTELSAEVCSIETQAGVLFCKRVDNLIEVNMGKAKTDYASIPLVKKMDSSSVDIGLNIGAGYCVNMGNPHVVFLCEDAEAVALAELGTKIENHSFFPERTNIEFVSPVRDGVVRMRVWERGGMITRACGSGACAVFVASEHYGIGGQAVEVVMDGGSLFMTYDNEKNVLMRGASAVNFKGVYFYD